MTLFASILAACGLSQSEAAELLGVRLDTVKSWSSGRRTVSPGALSELLALARRQDRAAAEAAEAWRQAGRPERVEVGVAADDHEARSLGWPSVGAHLAVARRLWELIGDQATVVVGPRGATQATAAAADAHRR